MEPKPGSSQPRGSEINRRHFLRLTGSFGAAVGAGGGEHW